MICMIWGRLPDASFTPATEEKSRASRRAVAGSMLEAVRPGTL